MSRHRTILYVEDNLLNVALVQALIDKRPLLRLLVATSGLRGVALAREALPDVILMDINIPGINGVEALIILRNDPATAHIPILAVSANASPNDVERALRAGFLRYVTKPIRMNEFYVALDLALAVGTEW